jgi:hypothetical protein
LPEAFDIELPGTLSLYEYALHATETISLNRKALVYYNKYYHHNGFPNHGRLWLADPGAPPGKAAFPCWVHQYGQSQIPGTGGNFDLNVWCGTDAQKAEFFGEPLPRPTYGPTLKQLKKAGLVVLSNPDEAHRAKEDGWPLYKWDGYKFVPTTDAIASSTEFASKNYKRRK